jgi:hypothetical protein
VANSQKITYAEVDKDDLKQTNFEIIGKTGANYLIYKNIRDKHAITVYDANMKVLNRTSMKYLPEKLINTDFLTMGNVAYMFYQYQRKNVVYCMAVKLDADGNNLGEPIQMDTTEVNFWANNRVYTVINSDDKQQIAALKVNTRNDKLHIVTISRFNKELIAQQKTRVAIAMPQRNDFLTEFYIDNEGTVAFLKAVQNGENDNISKLQLMVKPAASETIAEYELRLNNLYLDDVRLKIDNFNRRFIITSFFAKTRRGNIDGLYTNIWDKSTAKSAFAVVNVLDATVRETAKGETSEKTAFNDFFLRNIIPKKNGGFIMAAEEFHTTSRGGVYNRNNFMWGSPMGMTPADYYMWSPYGYSFPWWRWNNGGSNQMVRFHADNVAVFSFDSTGRLEWNNVVNKSQYDDETDNYIGYQLVNTGDQLHFIFNQQERRSMLLTDQSITPDGQLNRNPTMKNLDKGYDFLPRLSKQVGARTIISPCTYRNYICFAKIEL